MMLKIGGYLWAQIQDHDYTQKEFAKIIDISPRALHRYLKDIYFPPLDVLAKMCNVLDIDLNEILEIHVKGNNNLLIHGADEMEVIKALRNSNPKDYEYIMRWIRYLIQELEIRNKDNNTH